MKILIINGPNLNLLGMREPHIYGRESYDDLILLLKNFATEKHITLEFFQSNHEGCIVDCIQKAYQKYDGIIINPAAYTHTSIAIPDAIKAIGIPTVEVHLSNILEREDYRKHSYTSEACIKTVMGKGFKGYLEAIEYLMANA